MANGITNEIKREFSSVCKNNVFYIIVYMEMFSCNEREQIYCWKRINTNRTFA